MKRTAQKSSLVTVLGALLSALLFSVAPAATAQAEARAASAPAVSYKNLTKRCSSITVDGQTQKQCQANFTLSVTRIKAQYKIKLVSFDPRHKTRSTLGQFVAQGTSASKRFKDVVISYGSPSDPVRLKFTVIVKNAAGQKVFSTNPRTL